MKKTIIPCLAASLVALTPLTRAQTVTLSDYYPQPLGAEWIYDGRDWDGDPAKAVWRVESTCAPVTLFTGCTPAVSYTTNCVRLYAAYLDRTTMVPYDSWYDYMVGRCRYGWFGSDDYGESIRVDGGGVLPAQITVGQTVSASAPGYLNGICVGVVTLSLQLIAKTAIPVPAGTFQDVLYLRQTFTTPSGSQVRDEWWARSVGPVKKQGVSGDGAAELFELIQYSIPGPPRPTLSIIMGNGLPRLIITGSNCSDTCSKYAVEYVNALNNNTWLRLVTNTLSCTPLSFPDTSAAGAPQRFYRAVLLPCE